MNAPVLTVTNVGKCYTTYRSNFGRFASWFGLPSKPKSQYWAVRDVSFSVPAGGTLAIIGQNGAGKSTLLKLITGTARPTVGQISTAGRISAVLELGLGFNPELTGRENVFQAGGLMGHSVDDLNRMMPEIIEFTELGEFFDKPMRVYSSGMQARLAFALATAERPDLLIVDEVLSVGDSYFQHKSFARIREFKEQGSSILFVTHSLADVKALCERVLLLDKGKVLRDGPPDEVIDFYNAMIAEKEAANLTIEQRRQLNGWLYSKSGSGQATLDDIKVTDSETAETVAIARVGQRLSITMDVRATTEISQLVLGCMLKDRTGHVVWGTNTWHTNQVVKNVPENQALRFRLDFVCALGVGSYGLSVALHATDVHIDSNFEWIDNVVVIDVVNAGHPRFIGTTSLAYEIHVLQ